MSLKKYLTEAELASVQPVTGDEFDISIRDLTNIETVVVEHAEGSITIALDETAINMLEHCGCTFEDEDEDKEQVDELAPVIGAIGGALGRGVAAGAGALARGAAKAVVGTGLKAAHDKLDKKLFGPKPAEGDYEYEENLNSIRKLSGMAPKETVKEEGYDTSSGGPYDRGAADSYYGRDPRPHKIVPYTGADGVKGQMQKVPLTDPAEIAAYKAGYSENDDRKDYGESQVNEISQDAAVDLIDRARKMFPDNSHPVHKSIAGLIQAINVGSSADDRYAAEIRQHLGSVNEAEYQGRNVPLGKPMQGDVGKFKVYVKDPSTGNVKKVNFGDKNMRIRKSNPGARKNFRARHNCKNPGPKTSARYWSCRKW
jgi:hypothetical protein